MNLHAPTINYYQCESCDTTWTDEWHCQRDDRCPACNNTASPRYFIDQRPRDIDCTRALALQASGVELELYLCAMFAESNGDNRLAEDHETPHFFDVMVKVIGKDPVIEIDNANFATAKRWTERFEKIFQLEHTYLGCEL